MVTWTYPSQLVRFAECLERAANEPSSISDAELIKQVRAAYWATNCWDFVEQSFAIISAACALRPQLAVELIADPIDAMFAGDLDSEDDIVAQGVALAHKSAPYVPLSEDGRDWLLNTWPSLENQAKAIFRRKLAQLADQSLDKNQT